MQYASYLSILRQSEEEGDEVEYDEFGFRLDVEDGPEDSSNALVSAPFEEENEETAAKRLKWIAQLEFAQTSEDHIARTDKLRELILEGIPHALRPQVCAGLKMIGAQVWGELNTRLRDLCRLREHVASMTRESQDAGSRNPVFTF